jgi:hypothetical protein
MALLTDTLIRLAQLRHDDLQEQARRERLTGSVKTTPVPLLLAGVLQVLHGLGRELIAPRTPRAENSSPRRSNRESLPGRP